MCYSVCSDVGKAASHDTLVDITQGTKIASPLIQAVKSNHKAVARRLIQDPNINVDQSIGSTGTTPLLVAIKKGTAGGERRGLGAA